MSDVVKQSKNAERKICWIARTVLVMLAATRASGVLDGRNGAPDAASTVAGVTMLLATAVYLPKIIERIFGALERSWISAPTD